MDDQTVEFTALVHHLVASAERCNAMMQRCLDNQLAVPSDGIEAAIMTMTAQTLMIKALFEENATFKDQLETLITRYS